MKKFNLIAKLLFSLAFCANLSAFDSVVEWEAIWGMYSKLSAQYIKPYDVKTKAKFVDILSIIEENMQKDLNKEEFSQFFKNRNASLIRIQQHKQDVINKMSKPFTSDELKQARLSVIKEMSEQITIIDPKNEKAIIANSTFLNQVQMEPSSSSVSSAPKPNLPSLGAAMAEAAKARLNKQDSASSSNSAVLVKTGHAVVAETGSGRLVNQPESLVSIPKLSFTAAKKMSVMHDAPVEMITVTSVIPSTVSSASSLSESAQVLSVVSVPVIADNSPQTLPANDANKASNWNKYLAGMAMLTSAGLYKLATTEKFQKDPRLALIAKLVSGGSAVYGIYNIFKK